MKNESINQGELKGVFLSLFYVIGGQKMKEFMFIGRALSTVFA